VCFGAGIVVAGNGGGALALLYFWLGSFVSLVVSMVLANLADDLMDVAYEVRRTRQLLESRLERPPGA